MVTTGPRHRYAVAVDDACGVLGVSGSSVERNRNALCCAMHLRCPGEFGVKYPKFEVSIDIFAVQVFEDCRVCVCIDAGDVQGHLGAIEREFDEGSCDVCQCADALRATRIPTGRRILRCRS